jgi:hypothetical protein
MWSKKLLAYAKYSRFKDKMSGKGMIPVEIVQILQREEKGKAKRRKRISRNVVFKVVTTKLNSSKKTTYHNASIQISLMEQIMLSGCS